MAKVKTILTLVIVTLITVILLSGFIIATKRSDEVNYFACGTLAIDNVANRDANLEDHEGEKLFYANCKACHRLDVKLVGPPLRGVFQQRDSVWLRKMIIGADKMIAKGDRLAVKIFNEYNKTQHTNFEHLTKEQVDALMNYFKLAGKN